MEQAAAVAAAATPSKPGSSTGGYLSFINLNTGYEFSASLGFFVALDGAARLGRLLPTAGLVSYSPPGSLYQVRCWAVRSSRIKHVSGSAFLLPRLGMCCAQPLPLPGCLALPPLHCRTTPLLMTSRSHSTMTWTHHWRHR
jgi:hypothetical protein